MPFNFDGIDCAPVQAQRLSFPLLTDQSDFLRKSFGIKGDLMGLLPGRQTYVIDKKGRVALSFNDQVRLMFGRAA